MRKVIFILLALLAVQVMASAYMTIVNNTGRNITALYMNYSHLDFWGDSWLTSGMLEVDGRSGSIRPGDSRTYVIDSNIYVDFKAVDSSGQEYYYWMLFPRWGNEYTWTLGWSNTIFHCPSNNAYP